LLCSLERARSTQRQLRPMWRRVGLPAANAKGKPFAFMGRLAHALSLSGCTWAGCGRHVGAAASLGAHCPCYCYHLQRCTPFVFICFIINCLTRARATPPLRLRERGLGDAQDRKAGHCSLKQGRNPFNQPRLDQLRISFHNLLLLAAFPHATRHVTRADAHHRRAK
jgi:hypothetical protein